MSNKPNAYDLHCFIEQHKQPGDILYSVVDAAKDYRLAMASRDLLGEPLRPLFYKAPRHMDRVGPYMTRIQCTNRYPDYMKLWADRLGDNAGILLLSSSWPQAIRSHLRSIFKVYDERGAMFYFRYYDPRVIRTYLPTCTAKECRQFFGPVRSFLVEGEAPGTMLRYRAGQSAVQMDEEQIPVAEPALAEVLS
jgi:hypothetical protein